MHALDLLLTFRPPNVVARLGPRSRVPLLHPRELTAALRGGAPLACVPVLRPGALPGLLRAARLEDAVLGLALLHPLAERAAPDRFVASVRAAAEEGAHALPLFLQAGPLPVLGDAPALSAGLFRCVDAGFTLVSLDVRRLGEGAAAAVEAVAGPVVERELGLEVALPLGGTAPPVDALRRQLDALVARRVLPHFVRVDAGVVRGPGGVSVPWVERLREVVSDYGALLTGADEGAPGREGAEPWLRAGVGKLELSGPFTRVALADLPAEERTALAERATALGLSMAELLVVLGERLSPLTEAQGLRLEAGSFAEPEELLLALGLSGSARRVVDVLTARAR